MPRKTNATNAKGTLTGSRHFKKPGLSEETKTMLENAKASTEGVSIAQRLKDKMDAARGVVQTVSDTTKTINTGVKSIRQAFKGGSSLVTDTHDVSLKEAQSIAKGYGVELTDIKSHMGASNDTVDDSLGELSMSEASNMRHKIARQNNQLEVRHDRVKQKRKIASIYNDELGLVGDLVTAETTGVNVATKIVNYQIAKTNYGIAQSKLEETEELLIQQQIRTQGVLNLTEPIREEWRIKVSQHEANNHKAELSLKETLYLNARTVDEMNAWLEG